MKNKKRKLLMMRWGKARVRQTLTKKEFEMQMEVRGRLSMRRWFLSEPSTSRGTRNCLFIRRWKKWENETCIILNFVFFPLIFPYFVCANVGFCEIRLNEGNKFLAWWPLWWFWFWPKGPNCSHKTCCWQVPASSRVPQGN